jgi:predicted transcriptional regulator YdeE
METRIVEVKEFKVTGYGMIGPLSAIPGKWDVLNSEITARGVLAEESFGICFEMKGDKIHYIAGIKSNLAEDFPNTEEVIIPGGRFIVAKVEGGIPAIATTFNALMKTPGIQLRNCFCFERYIHPEGSNGYAIEVWMPIE